MSEEHRKLVCSKIAKMVAKDHKSEVKDLIWPDEDERNVEEIDCQFAVMDEVYVLEHTRIESYPGQLEDGTRFKRLLKPLEENLSKGLPTGRYHLSVNVGAVAGIKNEGNVRKSIAEWVKKVAPTLEVDSECGPPKNMIKERPEGVPFEVSLFKTNSQEPELLIFRNVPKELEEKRMERIKNAVVNKCPKLEKASSRADISILLLESNDIALANIDVISKALNKALNSVTSKQPDVIYLIETESKNNWYVWALKKQGLFYPEFFEHRTIKLVN